MLLTIILVLAAFLAFDHWTQLTGVTAWLVAAFQKVKALFSKKAASVAPAAVAAPAAASPAAPAAPASTDPAQKA